MYFQTGLVVFIDILGTKDNNFKNLYRINKLFHKKINDLSSKNIFDRSYYIKRVYSFSDCAYIIYTGYYDPDKGKYYNPEINDIYFFIEHCIDDLMSTLINFLQDDFLFRGGISIGDLYIDERENIFFGPAINDAYLLEREAIMPRIIFNEKLVKILKERFFTNHDDKSSPIWEDTYDSRLFLNYMNRLVRLDVNDFISTVNNNFSLNNNMYTFNDFIEISKIHSYNIINNSKDYNIISKHNWQLNYLERVKRNREKIIKSLYNDINKEWH
jgi:hypothetical protein